MKSKYQVILEIFYDKKSRNLIGQNNFGAKTQELDYQTSWNDWIKKYYANENAKIQYHSSTQSSNIADWTLGIPFDMPNCAWSQLYKWTELNRCTKVCLATCKKQIHQNIYYCFNLN